MATFITVSLLFSLSYGQDNYIYVNEYYTYAQAKAYCMSQYSTTLAVFDSLDSITELQTTVPDWESPPRAFIGLDCLDDQSTWQMANESITQNFCQGNCANYGVSDYWASAPQCIADNTHGQCAVIRRKQFTINESVIEWPCDDPQRFICNAPLTTTIEPSRAPTSSSANPSTSQITESPSSNPTVIPSSNPIISQPPSNSPSSPTQQPTSSPTKSDLTKDPNEEPSVSPTEVPSKRPTPTNLMVGQPNAPNDDISGESETKESTIAPVTVNVNSNESNDPSQNTNGSELTFIVIGICRFILALLIVAILCSYRKCRYKDDEESMNQHVSTREAISKDTSSKEVIQTEIVTEDHRNEQETSNSNSESGDDSEGLFDSQHVQDTKGMDGDIFGNVINTRKSSQNDHDSGVQGDVIDTIN